MKTFGEGGREKHAEERARQNIGLFLLLSSRDEESPLSDSHPFPNILMSLFHSSELSKTSRDRQPFPTKRKKSTDDDLGLTANLRKHVLSGQKEVGRFFDSLRSREPDSSSCFSFPFLPSSSNIHHSISKKIISSAYRASTTLIDNSTLNTS